MKIDQIKISLVNLKLKEPFVTNIGVLTHRESTIIQIFSEGLVGFGEAPAWPNPLYNSEDTKSVLTILEKTLCPLVLEKQPNDLSELNNILASIEGSQIAKAGIELAYWDLVAKSKNISLSAMLGATKKEIEIGGVLSICKDTTETIFKVEQLLEQGYKRVKLKIEQGKELEIAKALNASSRSSQVFFDFNQKALTTVLQTLDSFGLMMFEQPLGAKDFEGHAKLQEQLETSICLDESIESLTEAQKAHELKACKIISLKPTKVGGISESLKIHEFTKDNGISLYLGGMLETGVGKAHNLALASLNNFTLPAEISESCRYFEEDILEDEIRFLKPGMISVPENSGIGMNVCLSKLKRLSIFKLIL